MQKVIMIAIKNNTCWIRPDQIERMDPVYQGDTLIQLKVYKLNDPESRYTLNDPEDIKKVMRFLVVLQSFAEVEEFASPDVPF